MRASIVKASIGLLIVGALPSVAYAQLSELFKTMQKTVEQAQQPEQDSPSQQEVQDDDQQVDRTTTSVSPQPEREPPLVAANELSQSPLSTAEIRDIENHYSQNVNYPKRYAGRYFEVSGISENTGQNSDFEIVINISPLTKLSSAY